MPWMKLREATLRIASGMYDRRLRDQPPTRNQVKQAARLLDVLEPPHDHVHDRDLPRIAQQLLVERFGTVGAPGSPRPPMHPMSGTVRQSVDRALRHLPRCGGTAPAAELGAEDGPSPT
jgi:hypothetical protein